MRVNPPLGTISPENRDAVAVTGGAIDDTSIGLNAPAPGHFTTLSASATASFGAVAITGGSINGAIIGASAPAAGTFTALAGQTVTASESGVQFMAPGYVLASDTNFVYWLLTGTQIPTSIYDATRFPLSIALSTGQIQMGRGLAVAGGGAFDTLHATGAVTFTGTLSVSGAASFAAIDASPIGQTTAAAGKFTTLVATGSATFAALSATSIDATPIGQTTPAAAKFTNLTVTGTASFVNASFSSINGTPIGNTSPSSGVFTTLSATGAASFGNVAISGGSINGTSIGGTAAAAGSFTTLSASATASFGAVAITGGSVNGAPIGQTTPAAGAFTTLSANGAATFSGAATFTNGLTVSGNPLTLPASAGTNQFQSGTGDGATYSTYNVKWQLWNGLGLADYSGTVRSVYNARNGSWDCLGGFYVNGVAAIDGSRNALLNSVGAGNVTASLYQIAGTTVVDGSRNGTFTAVAATDVISTTRSGAQFLASGYLHYSDSSNYYLLLTGTSTPTATFNTLRPIQISLSTGFVTMADGLSVTGGGAAVTGGLTTDTLSASGTASFGGVITANAFITANSYLNFPNGAVLDTYGTVSMAGSKGGFSGVHFNDAGRTFMVQNGAGGQWGIWDPAGGWEVLWNGGTLSTGTIPAANVGAGALANGMTATTQSATDASGKLATTQQVQNAITTYAASPGDVKYTASRNVPTGWLAANGAAISRTAYAALFAAITTAFTGTLTSGSTSVTSVSSTTNLAVGMPVSGTGIAAGATIASIGSGTITLSVAATAAGAGVAITGAQFGIGDGSTTFNLPDMRGVFLRGWDNGRGLDANRVFGSYAADTLASHYHDSNTMTTAQDGLGGYGAAQPGSAGFAGKVVVYGYGNGIETGSTGGAETAPKNIAVYGLIKY